jgi:hypothetical protein
MSWVEDLEWWDGPLLSLWEAGGIQYLWYWMDQDDTGSCWLIVPVSEPLMQGLQAGTTPLLKALTDSEVGWTLWVDRNGDTQPERTAPCNPKQIPADNLPVPEVCLRYRLTE